MKPEIAIAVIAAVVSVTSALINVYGQVRTAKLKHRLQKQNQAEEKAAIANEIINKYRNPILRTAFDFQSRLYNIVNQNFLLVYYHQSPYYKDYAIHSTLYVIAEYLGWVEILRREIQFLDLGDIEMNRRLENLMYKVTQAFSSDAIEMTFCLFRGEQKAIGEIMLSPTTSSMTQNYECIGFATFVQRLKEPEFSQWFVRLQQDIEKISNSENRLDTERYEQRLIKLQHALIDLIDFLDESCIRFPPEIRRKI
jgi:hypothetical protein